MHIVKKEIEIFTIGLWENYPTIMVDPPVEYLKMCNFPQIPTFSPRRSNIDSWHCVILFERGPREWKIKSLQLVNDCFPTASVVGLLPNTKSV